MPVLTPNPAPPGDVSRLLKLQVPVIVTLAERRLPVSELLRLAVGSVIEFDKPSDEPLALQVNNKTVAAGVAVKVGEKFGLRLTQVGDTRSLIQTLGGGSRRK